MPAPPDLPPGWLDALDRAEGVRRVAVIGPTDSGKSSFIRALAERRPERRILDLDPGQKMIGPPGTASLGRIEPERRLDRFIFLGSTAVGSFRTLAAAAGGLAAGAPHGFIVNTSGYVAGPGARMQAMTMAALAPELVVAIAPGPALEPLLSSWPSVRLERSPAAARKSRARRAEIRGLAMAEALAGAQPLRLPALPFEPAPPLAFEDGARPVCSLADGEGEDMALAILTGAGGELFARPPPRPVHRIRLGRMWVEPAPGGWKLLERLAPAWGEESFSLGSAAS